MSYTFFCLLSLSTICANSCEGLPSYVNDNLLTVSPFNEILLIKMLKRVEKTMNKRDEDQKNVPITQRLLLSQQEK